ncbi:MAG: hypothetical protein ACXVBH_02505 [Flavisolibacter sp.]
MKKIFDTLIGGNTGNEAVSGWYCHCNIGELKKSKDCFNRLL